MEKKIIYPTAERAYTRTAQFLRNQGLFIQQVIYKNRMRHALIQTPHIDFYCLYRKDTVQNGTFEKFNEYFKEFVTEHTDMAGHAESINKDILDKICKPRYDPTNESSFEKDIVLIYIYKDTKAYIANPFLFKRFAEKYTLVRTHKAPDIIIENGKKKEISEETAHLPLKPMFFKNMEEWIDENKTTYLFKET